MPADNDLAIVSAVVPALAAVASVSPVSTIRLLFASLMSWSVGVGRQACELRLERAGSREGEFASVDSVPGSERVGIGRSTREGPDAGIGRKTNRHETARFERLKELHGKSLTREMGLGSRFREQAED